MAAIAGISVGLAVVIGVLIGFLVYKCKAKKKGKLLILCQTYDRDQLKSCSKIVL